MSRLTRDETAEPVFSHETSKFSGANGDREITLIFPVRLTTTSRIGNLTRLILTSLL